jgi:hypothetical protein
VSHVHAHAPHELSEPPEHAADVEAGSESSTTERWLELGAVVLLSLATLATAWSGYQAALWSGVQSQRYSQASALRVRADEDTVSGGQLHLGDLMLVNGWFNAIESGNRKLAGDYRRRFRPTFQPVFKAWLALDPLTNRRAPPGPTYMPQYRPAPFAAAAVADAHADRVFAEGTEAKTNDDDHILATVFFAAVLFLAAVSLRLEWMRLRLAVLGFGTIVFVGALIFVVTLPTTT